MKYLTLADLKKYLQPKTHPFEEENDVEGISVRFDAELLESPNLVARRPYYQLRGKPVSSEQALEIYSLADSYVRRQRAYPEGFDGFSINFDINVIERGFPGKTWLYPNGFIGEDAWMSCTNPNIMMLVQEWVSYVHHFPYLDLVIAVTRWDEYPEPVDELWHSRDGGVRSPDREERENTFKRCRAEVCSHLELGIWVHDGRIEFLSPKNCAEKFREYDKKYPFPFVLSSMRGINVWNGVFPREFTPEYINRIMEKAGLELTDEQFLDNFSEMFEVRDPVDIAGVVEKEHNMSRFYLEDLEQYTSDDNPFGEINDVSGVEVRFDSELLGKQAFAHRPYYQLRGKSVSKGQALDILSKADSTVRELYYEKNGRDDEDFGYAFGANFAISCFSENASGSWIYPSGQIGADGIMEKSPTVVQLVREWTAYALNFPYLDLIVAITRYDGTPPELIKPQVSGNGEQAETAANESREKFRDNIQMGIRLCKGKLEFLGSKNCAAQLLLYDKKYPFSQNDAMLNGKPLTPDYIKDVLQNARIHLDENEIDSRFGALFRDSNA